MTAKKMTHKIYAKIIARCWKDPEFKKRLLAHPREAMEEFGVELPKEIEIDIREEKKGTIYLLIPRSPTNLHQLSESELEKLAAAAKEYSDHCGEETNLCWYKPKLF